MAPKGIASLSWREQQKCLNTTCYWYTQGPTWMSHVGGTKSIFSAESNGWFNRLLLLWWFFYLKYKFMSCILNDEMTYGFEIAYLEPMPEAWYCNVRNCMLTPNMLLQGARAGNLHIYVDRFFSFRFKILEFQLQRLRFRLPTNQLKNVDSWFLEPVLLIDFVSIYYEMERIFLGKV